ncbi:MAG: hypothetical protein D6698_16640 [Gammaproteobacteria bacterium]|nr:MAG: hypothetical protein D6698_16640 [Gammaproteobacteria bacterium]
MDDWDSEDTTIESLLYDEGGYKTCRRCGKDFLSWWSLDGRWRLVEPDGREHCCPDYGTVDSELTGYYHQGNNVEDNSPENDVELAIRAARTVFNCLKAVPGPLRTHVLGLVGEALRLGTVENNLPQDFPEKGEK